MAKELTRRAIQTAFIQLLNERPLDKITVKNIVETCGINRNTFYYHYQDIYALLEDIFEQEAQAAIDRNSEHDTWREGFIESTQFALQNKRAIYHIYNSVNREQLERYLFRVTEHMMEDFVRRQATGLKVAEEDIHYIAVFYKHAIVGVVMEWLQRGMQDDAEAVILKMGRIFDGNIRRTLERLSQ